VHKMNNKHKIKYLSIGSTQEPLEAGEPSAAAFEQEMVGGSRCHCCVSTEHSMPKHQLRWKGWCLSTRVRNHRHQVLFKLFMATQRKKQSTIYIVYSKN